MLVSKAVDRVFIGGVIVNVLVSKAVDHGFIGGVMVSISIDEPTIYWFLDKHSNQPR
jgi:hypothetical protein